MADYAIEVVNVSKSYYVGNFVIEALKLVNFNVNKQDFLCILGPNGAGKTTLLKIIAGFLKPDKGFVKVFGENPFNNSKVGNLVGFMPQEEQLLETLTISEHIELIAKAKKIKDQSFIKEVMERLGLTNLLKRKPKELSMGQRRLAQLILSLIHKPKILLLDEPTAYLDNENTLRVLEIIRKLNKDFGITIVSTTHDPQIINAFLKSIILREGRIVKVVIKR